MKLQKCLIINFIIIFSLFAFVPNTLAETSEEMEISKDFNLQFKKVWGESENNTDEVDLDIDSIIGNLTESDFLADGLTAYVGSEIPTKTLTKRYYRIRLVQLNVYKDGDSIGAGDFFFRGTINKIFYDQGPLSSKMWQSFDLDLGEFNNGEIGYFNEVLYEGWAAYLNFDLELYDDDAGSVDTFGTKSVRYYHPTISGPIQLKYDERNSVGNNATVFLQIDILGGPNSMSAADILDAYKPYLYADVETSYQCNADYVWGRVIEGFDQLKNKNTSCLQILYFFPYEYSGSNVFVHHWDWEMIYIFLDFDSGLTPYRIVWDNGFYFTSSQDWIDGQDYRIYELYATPQSDCSIEVQFTDALKPFLGESREMKFNVVDLNNYLTMEYFGYFEWGLPTVHATIDTSYHQFDMGGPNFYSDAVVMNRDYVINQMDTTMLKWAYERLKDSFNNGVHQIGGVYTPLYAPFSWDVGQPFTRPYILNNYPKLVCDINSFNNAQNSKNFEISVDKKIVVTIDCPANLNMKIPKQAAPNQIVNTDLKVNLDQSNAKFTIDVLLNFSVSIDLLFFSKEWTYLFNQSLIFNGKTNTVTIFGKEIRIEHTGLEALRLGNLELGDYVSITGELAPKLIGDILSVEIAISLYEILKSFITNPVYTTMLDLLIEDFSLVINPVVSGYMQMDVLWGDLPIVKNKEFTEENSTIPVTFTMPAANNPNIQMKIDNLLYGCNFRIDWGLELGWATLPSLFIDDMSWGLGTWPNISIPLTEGTASLTSVSEYQYSSESEQWQLIKVFNSAITSSNDNQKDDLNLIPGFISIGFVCILIVSVITISIKRRRVNS